MTIDDATTAAGADPDAIAEQPTAHDTAMRLHSVAIHLLRRLRREDVVLGISAARLSALSVVGFGGPHTLGDLAAAEQVTPPTMTRIVAALEFDGLVRRQSDAADGRVSRVEITPKGWQLLERGRAQRSATLAQQFDELGDEELATLARAAAILERILGRPES
jgi:DNA-binding MarR family transcriptional regulator